MRKTIDFSFGGVGVAIQNVVIAGGDEGDGSGFAFYGGVDHGRSFGVFGEEIVPGLEDDGVDEDDLAGNVPGLGEIGGSAVAGVDHRHVLDGGECGRPGDGDATDAEFNFWNLREFGIERGTGGADRHLGGAFRPGVWDGEFFGVNAVCAGGFEHLHSPVDGALHGGSAGNAAADFVGEMAQVAFDRRGLEGLLNDAVGIFVGAWGDWRLRTQEGD